MTRPYPTLLALATVLALAASGCACWNSQSQPSDGDGSEHASGKPSTSSEGEMKIKKKSENKGVLVTLVAVAPDGKHWAATYPGGVRTFAGDKETGIIREQHNAAGRIEFTDDGKGLRLGSRVLDLADKKWRDKPSAPDMAAWAREQGQEAPETLGAKAALISSDGELMVVAASGVTRDRQKGMQTPPEGIDPDWLFVLDGATGKLRATLWHGKGENQHVAISDTHIVAGGTGLRVFDRESGKLEADLSKQLTGIIGLAFSPDNKLLAALGQRSRLAIWRVGSFDEPLHSVEPSDQYVRSLAFHPKKAMLAVGDQGGVLRLLSTEGGKVGAEVTKIDLGGQVNSMAFAPDGKSMRAALGPPATSVVLLSVKSGLW